MAHRNGNTFSCCNSLTVDIECGSVSIGCFFLQTKVENINRRTVVLVLHSLCRDVARNNHQVVSHVGNGQTIDFVNIRTSADFKAQIPVTGGNRNLEGLVVDGHRILGILATNAEQLYAGCSFLCIEHLFASRSSIDHNLSFGPIYAVELGIER